MGKTIRIRVDESLQHILERVRREIAVDIKKKYNLHDVTVYGPLASQIIAAKCDGKGFLNFRIRKVGLNQGILELIN